MADEKVPTRESFIPIAGATLRIVEQGAGTPVLVPSGAGIEFYRNTFSARLVTAMRFIYVETRGTGGSTGAVAGCTFASMADDLDQVRAGLGLERVAVLGQSNHGAIAMEYALRHPARTLAAIPIASSPDFTRAFALGRERWMKEASPDLQADLARRQAAFEALDKSALTPDEISIHAYIAMSPLGWRDRSFDVASVWGGISRNAADYMQLVIMQHGSTWNITPRFGEIKAPVLAISGRYDYLCPFELWSESIARLPNGRLEILEASAHNPQFEERERFDPMVIDFVRKHSS